MSSSLRSDASGLLGALQVNGVDTVTFDSAGVNLGVEHPIKSIVASVAANALTVGLATTTLEFRSSTLSIGATTRLSSPSQTMTIPSGATLGTVNAVQSRITLLAINNAGVVELAVTNSGGQSFDESALINTTVLNSSSNSANVIYSTIARTGVPFRVVGFVDSTQATAGAWATTPTVVQGSGGQVALGSKLFSGVLQPTTSGTFVDFTGIPAWAKRITVVLNAVGTNGTSLIHVQIGAGSIETTGYQGSAVGGTPGNVLSGGASTIGFNVINVINAASTTTAIMTLVNIGGNVWVMSGTGAVTGVATSAMLSGVKTTAGILDRVRLTMVNGTDVFDGGSVNIMWE